eukprot:jgi/Bigna1/78846/fgenesh1_pg.57_\
MAKPTCGICEGPIQSQPIRASCGHVFRKSCIRDYVKTTGMAGLTCPVCFDIITLTTTKKIKKKTRPRSLEGEASGVRGDSAVETKETEQADRTGGSADSRVGSTVGESSSLRSAEEEGQTSQLPSSSGDSTCKNRTLEASSPSDGGSKNRKRRRSVTFADKIELGRTGMGIRSSLESAKKKKPRPILRRREGDIPKQPDDEPDWYCIACQEKVKHKDKHSHVLSIGHNIKATEMKNKINGPGKLNTGVGVGNRGYQMLVRLGWDERSGLGADGRTGIMRPIATQLRHVDEIGMIPKNVQKQQRRPSAAVISVEMSDRTNRSLSGKGVEESARDSPNTV